VKTIIKAPDSWMPEVGQKILIKDFFYNGIDEFEIVKIQNERWIVCKLDGIEHLVDLNYFRPDIYMKE
jgi:hypothetical protein